MRPKQSRFRDVERVLRKLGFEQMKTGATSHIGFRHPDGRKTVLACHPGDVPYGTLRKIIGQVGITVEQYNETA